MSAPPSVTQAVERLPAPLRAGTTLWFEQLLEREPPAAEVLAGDAVDAQALVRLVAVSEYAGRQLLRDWAYFADALATGRFDAPPRPDWRQLRQDGDEAGFKRQLRLLRNRTMLHVLWRMLSGSATVAETLESLSTLADSLVAAAEGYARQRLEERAGVVRDAEGQAVPLIVLGMGKLGGRELNFSSDIDLVFLYPRGADSDGGRALPAQDYFARLSQRVVALLGEATADGFVYRVDTRLRPFGDSGPPVVSFSALESYLLNHGRDWERYAYVKARAIVPAGRHDDVQTLRRELIEPFVYRRYLDFGVFESLREMKDKISAEVRRQDMAANIKLGPGGIREIEFIVQSLQLVRGGSVRSLRERSLVRAVRGLVESRCMDGASATELLAAYDGLRRVENFLQALRDQQVHDLPSDDADRARLALAMGAPDWPSLQRAIDGWRDAVSNQFARVAFRNESEHRAPELVAAVAAQCDAGGETSDWQQLLETHGFDKPAELAGVLQEFLEARSTRQIDTTARRRLHHLLPRILDELRHRQDAVITLRRLVNLLSRILRRSAYVALLNENAAVLARLIDLCEKSAYLSDEIARFPLLLDEIMDARLYSEGQNRVVLRDELAGRLAQLADSDSESRVEVVAQFQRAALFRIAAADFSGNVPVMKISDRLTDLAEIVLAEALNIAWLDTVARFGEPRFLEDGANRAAGLGVIAYGKLGGIELSYGSDLDLVFLHNSRGDEQQTNGARPLENGMFFVRLARRLVHFLTTQTRSGALYEVDTRLRPSGKAGLLVTSVEAFDRYQRENAWTWEYQALLRARPVAGHAGVARDFERIRSETLVGRVKRETLREDVRAMREKMRGALDTGGDGFDLKQGAGGIADIEFLVQYLVLRFAADEPALIHFPDNVRQLGSLGKAGILPRDEVAALQDTYRAYRLRSHQLRLDDRPPRVAGSDFREERDLVQGLWRHWLGDGG